LAEQILGEHHPRMLPVAAGLPQMCYKPFSLVSFDLLVSCFMFNHFVVTCSGPFCRQHCSSQLFFLLLFEWIQNRKKTQFTVVLVLLRRNKEEDH